MPLLMDPAALLPYGFTLSIPRDITVKLSRHRGKFKKRYAEQFDSQGYGFPSP